MRWAFQSRRTAPAAIEEARRSDSAGLSNRRYPPRISKRIWATSDDAPTLSSPLLPDPNHLIPDRDGTFPLKFLLRQVLPLSFRQPAIL